MGLPAQAAGFLLFIARLRGYGRIRGLVPVARRVASDLRCQACGSRYVVYRKKGRLRPRGHIKHLWCIVCKERTPHIEERGF